MRSFNWVENLFLRQDSAEPSFMPSCPCPIDLALAAQTCSLKPYKLLSLVSSRSLRICISTNFAVAFFLKCPCVVLNFGASWDENCRRSVRELARGVWGSLKEELPLFFCKLRHCLFPVFVSCNFFRASSEADYKRSVGKPARGGERVKACKRRSMGEAL